MAPFLAIGGFGLADLYLKNKQDPSSMYRKLVPKGDCKPVQNACEIEGIGLTLHVNFETQPVPGQAIPVTVTSETRLDDVALSLLSNDLESAAVSAVRDEARRIWKTLPTLPEASDAKNVVMRLAVSNKGKLNFVEVPLVLQ